MNTRAVFKNACLLVIFVHLAVSLRVIGKWAGGMFNSYMVNFAVPAENRLFTMSMSEYRFILDIRRLPEDANVLWLADPDPIINYYMYPRQMFRVKKNDSGKPTMVSKEFLKERNIAYVLDESGKFYPLTLDEEVPQAPAGPRGGG